MSNRRRNLFVLAFVGLLIMASGIVIATKKTTLGLDLKGGTELIFQARPTPQNPSIDGSDIDRAIEIIRKRTDAFGVSEPEISRIGSDSIRVGLPDVATPRTRAAGGQTAQLQFYDWEPNVIPNPAKTNVPPGESSFSRALRRGQARLSAEAGVLREQVHDRRARSTTSSTPRPTPGSPARPTTEGPVLRAAGPEAAAEQRDRLRSAGHARGGEGA